MNTVYALLRLATFGAVGLVALALGIGLASPDEAATATARRILDPEVPVQLPLDADVPKSGASCWFADPSTGRLSAMPMPAGEVLEKASLSPWRDDRGRRQAIGRWNRFGAERTEGPSEDFGMALFSYPDGHRLETFPMNLIPIGPPCWSPHGDPEVLFPATDGTLYALSIAGDGPHAPSALRSARGLPWREMPRFLDLCWPADPRFGGRLFTSIQFCESTATTLSKPELWWLRLSADHRVIVDAGRLDVPGDRALGGQFPEVAALGDGRMTLAFLADREGRSQFELTLAPLTFGPGDDAPRLGPATVLAGGCFPTRPAFSTDGNALTYVSRSHPGGGLRPARIDLAADRRIATTEYAAQASPEAPAL